MEFDINYIFQYINFFIFLAIPIILLFWLFKISKRLKDIEEKLNKKNGNNNNL
ncbi:hypothetical protein [Candidatus Contubernalis alkaliaceticus]|uniref:hypothetical protein n=1 Tax=Candidatus Contubernalis alkaliaceticus TaxID=338645 RepID=UPI001F4C2EE7|nr:hypothetical protein [Candidatus Contubernalis alkalaceticus]UNC92814.1 hypothetical protein HUE98_12330 [Candidatus Contubernalis alkalaceticus]